MHRFFQDGQLFTTIYFNQVNGDSDVGESMLVTILGCWWPNFDVGDIFGMLVPDANAKR